MVATPGDKGFNNFILPNPFKMWKLLKKIAPDIVHIHTPSPFGYMALLMAKSLHIPLVYTSHMFSEHIVVETNTWSKQMARKVVDVLFAGYMRKFDTIIYPSPIQQDIMTAKYDLRNNAVAISNGSIPFGENASAEKPDTWRDKTVFFTISRLSKEKNIHRLLNAFDRVHEQHANAILVVVGDGIARKELETSARQKASSDSIFFVGQQRGDALARYFKTGDVFVSASDRESEGLTTLEAVSFGKPLILSDAPGNAARQFLE